MTRYKLGVNKNGIPQNNISREKYTFLEALKIMEIAEKSKNNNQLKMLIFWQKVEEALIIPGRTGQGLRGAYRKFWKFEKEDVLKSILQNDKGRYSHYFEYPPTI